tara:strand:+ start:825 stop:1373 length:549 start_codon:yes stop_codon:yes gene_type:complete
MATRHHNISGELTQELLAAGDGVVVNSISLVNTHASTTCTVDLYIERRAISSTVSAESNVEGGKFYIVKSLSLAVGASAILKDVKFSNKAGEFSLYIKLSKSNVFTLTGTIDPIADATVTGVNTLFLTEIAVGDEIIVSGETRTVASIASNTELEVTVATTNTSNDTTPDCSPKSNVDVIIN